MTIVTKEDDEKKNIYSYSEILETQRQLGKTLTTDLNKYKNKCHPNSWNYVENFVPKEDKNLGKIEGVTSSSEMSTRRTIVKSPNIAQGDYSSKKLRKPGIIKNPLPKNMSYSSIYNYFVNAYHFRFSADKGKLLYCHTTSLKRDVVLFINFLDHFKEVDGGLQSYIQIKEKLYPLNREIASKLIKDVNTIYKEYINGKVDRKELLIEDIVEKYRFKRIPALEKMIHFVVDKKIKPSKKIIEFM